MDYTNEVEQIFGAANTQKLVHRSMDVMEFLIFCSSIGLFAGFWKLYEHILARKRNINVKISYVSENQQVEVELKQLSQQEYQEVLAQYPPSTAQQVRLLIS